MALPTSFLFLALLEKITAPSIPINTQTVTSIVLLTWLIVLAQLNGNTPSDVILKKPVLKVSKLNAIIMHMITSKIGINFATVTILLINAAVSTPFKIKKWTPQSSNEATIILGNVLPPLKIGKKLPTADINSVA